MLKKLLHWAFKDEIVAIAKQSQKKPKISEIKAKTRKQYTRNKKHIAFEFINNFADLAVNESFIIENPKLNKPHWHNKKQYPRDYAGYGNKYYYPKRRFSQMFYNGKLIITRVK